MTGFRDVARAGVELAVVCGMIEAAIDDDAPDEVREAFGEKCQHVVENLERELHEFIDFGEAYDRE